MHFDGATWKRVPAAEVGSGYGGFFNAIATLGANDIWAVGAVDKGGDWGGLIEHWDGSRWRRVSAPGTTSYYAIDAAASNDIWAVGSDSPRGRLASRWNGRRWSDVGVYAYPGNEANANSVSASAPNNVWIVGEHFGGPLIDYFDGRRFRSYAIPPSHYEWKRLDEMELWEVNDVFAFASNDVVAVGNFGIERFDGRRWQQQSRVSLAAVDAASPTEIWAVGRSSVPSFRAVVVRYTCRPS